ncbi:MAG: sorbosone dehydrogenase family protein [Gammaproteobacteria bacterium]|nr:sorbosone dehydrogenase family protein [Gammaproteobacteria bacterium]QOJ31761.1 MAG: sorbosone dehydrogenase family protein [Gammaproteobacteria bacterium]
MWIRRWLPCLLTLLPVAGMAQGALPGHLKLPPGFAAELLAPVPGARSMAMGRAGTLFVGTQRGGKVYAVRGALGGSAQTLVLAEGLKMPNGIAFRDGALYVAEPERILRFDGIESRLERPPAPTVVVDNLPTKGMLHSWRYLAFGPDDKLYVSLGAPCNVCNEPDFGAILRMNPDGSGREYFARGVRNSVGFTWDPGNGDMWFTDNGRDMLGDDRPPDELNHATRPGLDFGFPYCHGGTISDPEFGGLGQCKDAVAPVQALGPHVAALGLRFYTGSMFPAGFRGQVLIAEHGSWNRSKEAGRTGYRVSLVRMEKGKAVAYEPFIEGFLDGDQVLGRPVDLLVAPDGSLLVSDDTAGAIYRISYRSAD